MNTQFDYNYLLTITDDKEIFNDFIYMNMKNYYKMSLNSMKRKDIHNVLFDYVENSDIEALTEIIDENELYYNNLRKISCYLLELSFFTGNIEVLKLLDMKNLIIFSINEYNKYQFYSCKIFNHYLQKETRLLNEADKFKSISFENCVKHIENIYKMILYNPDIYNFLQEKYNIQIDINILYKSASFFKYDNFIRDILSFDGFNNLIIPTKPLSELDENIITFDYDERSFNIANVKLRDILNYYSILNHNNLIINTLNIKHYLLKYLEYINNRTELKSNETLICYILYNKLNNNEKLELFNIFIENMYYISIREAMWYSGKLIHQRRALLWNLFISDGFDNPLLHDDSLLFIIHKIF